MTGGVSSTGGIKALGGGDTGGSNGGAENGGAENGAAENGGAQNGGAGGADDGGSSCVADAAVRTLSPGEVYLLGALQARRAGVAALAHWSTPDTYAVGFPLTFAEADKAMLLGSKLIYLHEHRLRWFEPELFACVSLSELKYPLTPEQNDPILATPACSTAGANYFYTGPDGDFIYRCSDSVWYIGETPVYSGPGTVLALGHDGLLAIREARGLVTLGRSDSAAHLVPEIVGPLVAVRSSTNGFHAVDGSPTDSSERRLWEVRADGTATLLGKYPKDPYSVVSSIGSGSLDENDALYELRESSRGPVIVRRTIEGESKIVDSEADGRNVKLELGQLVTGP